MDKNFNSRRYAKEFKINKTESIRINQIINLIGNNRTVLDLGCGDGYIMEKIRETGNKVVGVEISSSAIAESRRKGFKVFDLNLNKDWSKYIKSKFDVVHAGEIIEHIFDTDKFLQNIRNVLKTKGSLVITTPNVASLGRRLLLLIGKSPLIEVTARLEDAGHQRYFTRKTLIKLLEENRFKINKIESSVVNFDVRGRFYSVLLARLFPQFGNNIIVKASVI